MSKLSEGKMFGGIAAILMLVGSFIPAVGSIVPLIGLVLIFIAVKYIADATQDGDIFRNYLFHFILTIVAFVAVIAIMLLSFGAAGGFSFIENLQSMDFTNFTGTDFMTTFGTLIGGCLLSIVVAWVLLIISAIYLRRSYDRIAKHTNVDLFKTTGLIYLIGAATLIILIGALIILVAKIIEIVAYFSLPETLEKPEAKEEMVEPA